MYPVCVISDIWVLGFPLVESTSTDYQVCVFFEGQQFKGLQLTDSEGQVV